ICTSEISLNLSPELCSRIFCPSLDIGPMASRTFDPILFAKRSAGRIEKKNWDPGGSKSNRNGLPEVGETHSDLPSSETSCIAGVLVSLDGTVSVGFFGKSSLPVWF